MEEYLKLDIDCEINRFRRSINNSNYSFRIETPTQKMERRRSNILNNTPISETSSVTKTLNSHLENNISFKKLINSNTLLKSNNYFYKNQEDALI